MNSVSSLEALPLCCSSVYTGLPGNIIIDEGSQFRNFFAKLAALHNLNIEKSGIKSHNSLLIDECYHKHLFGTYRQVIINYPNKKRQLLLALSTKTMKNILSPE